MLNFTEHMNRIRYLVAQALGHANEEDFGNAATDVMKISIHCNESMQQLDQLSIMKGKGKSPAGDRFE